MSPVGLLVCLCSLLVDVNGKWVEGRIDTKDNWAFLSRFCFLSLEGRFEYQIEFERDLGVPNLLLYFDDGSQWPAVYHSDLSCKEREAVLNKNGQNQIVKLSHWYPDMEYSGCVIKKEDQEVPAAVSSTTAKPKVVKNKTNAPEAPLDPTYYDQFLKTTEKPTDTKTTISDTSPTGWYEVSENSTDSVLPDDLWESVGEVNGSRSENMDDVELMFSESPSTEGHKIKRSTFALYERYRRRRLTAAAEGQARRGEVATDRYLVTCHNSRRFRSARERWWFIAVSNCDSPKGLDVRYRFLMTNGEDGDIWHEHFSADEFYILPVLLAYTSVYFIILVAVVMCSVELKSRHLLHSSYKLFVASTAAQHMGIAIQSMGYLKYGVNGFGGDGAKYLGKFLCGVSEMLFLLLLVLMGKGYSITRGRLKLGFTVKLTVFMCCYCVTYVVLFVYQAKGFDPGEVLYLYESPAGYGLLALRGGAWAAFAYSTFFTVRKFPEKNMFYCPFFACGSLWFVAGPLFILAANFHIDKWVRESVVTAVLLFIAFCGHVMFLLLTLPVFANKNFPYHIRTTQIGIMEVTGNGRLDNFGHTAYQPAGGAAQTVIIPLTRRTEELIGNMYNQYMASAPAAANDLPTAPSKLNYTSLSPQLAKQDSTDTNASEDIRPTVEEDKNEVFTVEGQMSKLNSAPNSLSPKLGSDVEKLASPAPAPPRLLPPLAPAFALARGPALAAMMRDADKQSNGGLPITLNGRKPLPAVRNGTTSSGEISTITEGRVQEYGNTVATATIDLFSANRT